MELNIKNVLLMLIMCSVFIASYAIYWQVPKKKRRKMQQFADEAKAKGCVAKAKLIKHRDICIPADINSRELGNYTDDSWSYLTYEYEVNGKTYKRKVRLYEQSTRLINYPDVITIYYDEHNPSKCIDSFDMKSNQGSAGCLTSIIFFCVVMFIIVHLFKSWVPA